MDDRLHDDRAPVIPRGNLEPYTLAGLLYDDFATAWNAMADCSGDPRVGGNLMFARQAFAYLELACRTASTHETGWYVENFSSRLAECDARYFTRLPGPVPLPHAEDFRLPAAVAHAPELQLLAALFDTARHGLAHLSQQIPVRLTDDKIWMASFTGVEPGQHMQEMPSTGRRGGHLAFSVSPNGHVYLIVRPDVLLADLRFAARLAAIFTQYNAPEYPQRPRPARARGRAKRSARRQPYEFSSAELISALESGGHERRPY